MPGPLNLAVIIERYNPDAGGAEKSTAQIVQRLVERGHGVTLIAGACSYHHQPDGVLVEALSTRKSSSFFRLARFARFARKRLAAGRYDVSLSITMAAPGTVLQPRGGTIRETLARSIAAKPPQKRATKRLGLAVDPKQNLLLALEKRTLADPRVKRIAAVSGYVVEQFARHYDVPAGRCVVIPNAAVMPAVDDATKARWREAVRRGWAVPDDATVYLFAAQNWTLKGFAPLVEALRKLIDRGAAASVGQRRVNPLLLLAGSHGVAAVEHLGRRGVREHTRVLGPTRSMPELFAAADATVLPTYYDPASKVVLESLMMGTPAITTRFNGAGDHLAPGTSPHGTPHGPRGIVLADPADADALADAMAALADPATRAAMGAACAGLAETLSMDRHVDALEALLHEVAGEG
jgi:UDP-glucose:(heptosyl)LPS alpha-1,3-glucosyltransferase